MADRFTFQKGSRRVIERDGRPFLSIYLDVNPGAKVDAMMQQFHAVNQAAGDVLVMLNAKNDPDDKNNWLECDGCGGAFPTGKIAYPPKNDQDAGDTLCTRCAQGPMVVMTSERVAAVESVIDRFNPQLEGDALRGLLAEARGEVICA